MVNIQQKNAVLFILNNRTHHYLSARPTATFDGVYKTNGEFLPSASPAIAVTDRYVR